MMTRDAVRRIGSNVLVAFVLPVLASCTSGPVKLADKDDTGRFDGEWIASVEGPRAKREELPGSWFVTCDWEPYSLPFRVSNGMVSRQGVDASTPISKDGKFQLTILVPRDGIESLNIVYRGTLGEYLGSGRYMEVFKAYGATGCSASVTFDRK